MDSTSHITIQTMTEADLDEVIALGLATPELRVNAENEPAYYPKEMLASFITSPNDIYLVAKVGGEFAGFKLASVNPYLKEAYLIDTVVKPAFRNQGVARALYQRTFELLNQSGCDWAWGLVKEDNDYMRHYVQRYGFRVGAKFYVVYKDAPFNSAVE